MPRRPSTRLLRALAVGLVAAAAVGGLTAGGVLDRVEHMTVDQRYELRGERTVPDVVVVGIDGETYERLGLSWPFPRWVHAQAIRALLQAGARAVLYDVQFSEPRNRAHDRELLAAAADRRVVLSSAELASPGEPAVIGGAQRLRARGGRIGTVLIPVDEDGVWRRLQARVHGVPHAAVLAADGEPDAGTHPIDFAGRAGTVRSIPFWRVPTGHLDAARVRDRVVVVGLTEPADQDVHPVPVGGDLMPGAELHANAVQTVLDGYPLRDAPTAVGVLLVLAAGLLAPLATLVGPPGRALAQALAAALLGGAALLSGAQLAFGAGTIVPVAAPLLALALGTLGAIALTYLVEVRTRRRLRTEFERFAPAAVVDELMPNDGSRPQIPSRRLEATVLFCDLRGFTALAEQLDAQQVIAVLNRYLDAVSSAVFAHGGTVVSYQGDGVLAVFGAPLPQSGHADRALAAARAILDDALPRFNAWLLEERLAEAPLDAGIGVNTGHVMSGLVGSERRLEYAAVGDATNVAARLQALGKELPGGAAPGDGSAPARLFVAASTHAQLGAAAEGLRRHGEVELRGRREPVTVYVAG